MEVSKIGKKGVKIRTKNASFLVNPEGKIDGDVVILTQKPQVYSDYNGAIVIDGPGEYEVSGVSIKGEAIDGSVLFDFLADSQRLLMLPTASISKSEEAQDYTATVVFLDENSKDTISQISSGVVIVVGDADRIFKDKTSLKKIDKVNLKKIDEYKGFIVHLSK